MPEYNPETILQERHTTSREQLQKQFEFQWNEINRQAREGLFKSPKEHESALHELYTRGKQSVLEFNQRAEAETNQLNEINKLAELGAIQNPDEVKWRLVLGPEAEQAMFPKQVDPREEHRRILFEENRLLDTVKSFVVGRDGKLYQAAIDQKGYYSDQPDKSKPATQDDIRLWTASVGALDSLEQQKLGIVRQMADMGIPNPNRLQDLNISTERENWFKRYLKSWYGGLTAPGLFYRGIRGIRKEYTERYGNKATGTFAQKVEQTLTTKPGPGRGIINQPVVQRKKLTPEIARQFMLRYGNRKDAQAAAEAEGYYE
jgi:hypothetical protein